VTDPATGTPIDYGTTVYRPPAALRDLIITRTPICDFPSCLVPAHRGDLDHREPHDPAAGSGTTNEHNIDPPCRVLCHTCEQWFTPGSPSTAPVTAWP
jgi:hypothetical protein